MMVVFVAVLFGVQIYQAKMNPPAASPSTPVAGTQAPAKPSGETPTAATATQPAAAAVPAHPAVPVVQASAETTTVVENESTALRFPTAGPRSQAGF